MNGKNAKNCRKGKHKISDEARRYFDSAKLKFRAQQSIVSWREDLKLIILNNERITHNQFLY